MAERNRSHSAGSSKHVQDLPERSCFSLSRDEDEARGRDCEKRTAGAGAETEIFRSRRRTV